MTVSRAGSSSDAASASERQDRDEGKSRGVTDAASPTPTVVEPEVDEESTFVQGNQAVIETTSSQRAAESVSQTSAPPNEVNQRDEEEEDRQQ